MKSPLHGCLISVGANSFALAATKENGISAISTSLRDSSYPNPDERDKRLIRKVSLKE